MGSATAQPSADRQGSRDLPTGGDRELLRHHRGGRRKRSAPIRTVIPDRKSRSVTPAPGVEARLVAGHGQECAPGGASPQDASPDERVSQPAPNGRPRAWIRTAGMTPAISCAGTRWAFFHFVGRADDMFVCGGENIYPGEVEKLLERHPAIHQACVVPAEDAVRGQKPVAFVVRAPGTAITEGEVKAFALAKRPATPASAQRGLRCHPAACGHQQDRPPRADRPRSRICGAGRLRAVRRIWLNDDVARLRGVSFNRPRPGPGGRRAIRQSAPLPARSAPP